MDMFRELVFDSLQRDTLGITTSPDGSEMIHKGP